MQPQQGQQDDRGGGREDGHHADVPLTQGHQDQRHPKGHRQKTVDADHAEHLAVDGVVRHGERQAHRPQGTMGQQGAAHPDAGGAHRVHVAAHHHRLGDDGPQALAQGGGEAEGDTDHQAAAHLFPFTLLVVAAPPEQDGEHDPGQHQQGTQQAPATEVLAKQPEPEQGGEERVAGEQQAAAPGPQPVHAGKEGGVADEDADEAGKGEQGKGALGEGLPAPGGEAGASQHQADQEHPPAAVGKGSQMTRRFDGNEGGDRP